MNTKERAELFEAHRGWMRAVGYRMLGSAAEADDAVQEAWLRLSRVGPADLDGVASLEAWLRTVVSRICLDMLRTRASRREEPLAGHPSAPESDPEDEVVAAESVGRAMLVVLDRLGPAERVAFVLHDLFAVPFDQIAPIVDRTPVAAKKLASRARRRVRGGGTRVPSASELARQRRVVEAFLAASRRGDLGALLAVLDPDVVRRADPAALTPGRAAVVRGAEAVAEEMLVFGGRARYGEVALVNGAAGVVIAPGGRLRAALAVTVRDGRVAAYEVIADPERLRRLDLAVPGE
jgi:RNA polymerase sigma factor (sigma-70 family)